MIKGFTFPHKPIPAVRTTGKMLWTKPAQNYAGYKQALATALAEAYPELVIPLCPPTTTKKADPTGWEARKGWDSEFKYQGYYLYVDFSNPNHISDIDNLEKAVMDALQLARIVPNDCQILTGWPAKFKLGKPETVVTFTDLPADEMLWRRAREQANQLFLNLIGGGHDA
jgi:Holliday junction resolvase RusA-like endonuclease